jgi:hypothetical protein
MAVKKKSKKSEAAVAPVIETPAPIVAPAAPAVVESTPVVGEAPVAPQMDSSEKELIASGGYFSGGRFYLPIAKILGLADYISKAGNRRTYAVYKVDTRGYTLMPISKSGKVAHSDIRTVGKATYVGFRVAGDRLVPGTVVMK